MFNVHAHLLVEYSDYFLKALNSGMIESRSLEFTLKEHAHTKTMAFLVDWIYEKPYNKSPRSLQAIVDHDDDAGRWKSTAYSLWKLADYLKVPELQNDTMRILFATRRQAGVGRVNYLQPDSPLMQFDCLRLASLICSAHWLERQKNNIVRQNQRHFLSVMNHDRLVKILMTISNEGGAKLEDADLDRFLVKTS